MSVSRALLAIERLGAAETAWLQDGLRAWFRAGGAIPLSRVLGLPSSPEGLRLALRGEYLRRAIFAAPGRTYEEQSGEVLAFITDRRTREQLRQWHLRGGPGYDIPEYQQLLLQAYAVKGGLPGEKQLRRMDIFPQRSVQRSLACSDLDHERG